MLRSQRRQECDSSLDPGACGQAGMCPAMIHRCEHSQILASTTMCPTIFFWPGLILVEAGVGVGGGMRINHV